MRRSFRSRWLCVSLLLAMAVPAHAAGPLLINGRGQAIVWATQPIPYNPDRGGLGVMDNASARQFVADRFATWSAVPTASLAFTDTGLMPADVTVANVGLYFGACGDHL